MDIGEKIKKMREAESLSQFNFAVETGINMGTLRHYEAGRTVPGGKELLKITQNPTFTKYTLWLMTGQTAPEAGQISPEIEQSRTA
ncbi:transcriptional regulator [Pseudohongiella nitratireducens]|uniref:Transcriptional regulator n=1 Tax=Pseudohongiella nitratireducens TaxID=1768907 RepID=A0A916QMH8_9GAMM|nr:helix-turn-helix domain-containing protein [Pseudohongiella nitratireducens]GFZ84087.1 transcriptional regulator [Pseudohongiella nitratireducens]